MLFTKQYGYQKNKSTKSAFIDFVNKDIGAFEGGEVATCCFQVKLYSLSIYNTAMKETWSTRIIKRGFSLKIIIDCLCSYTDFNKLCICESTMTFTTNCTSINIFNWPLVFVTDFKCAKI